MQPGARVQCHSPFSRTAQAGRRYLTKLREYRAACVAPLRLTFRSLFVIKSTTASGRVPSRLGDVPLGLTPVYDYLAAMGNLGSIAVMVLLCSGMLVVVLACWAASLLGLPGNWGILLAAVAYDWFVPADSARQLGWMVIGLLGALALVGEAIEFLAGAFGVRKRGGSRLSAVLALAGSILGALAGAIIALPVPVVGSVVGVLLGSSVGAMLGATLGEDLRGRDPSASLDVGWAAFWGRLWGTVGKALMGAIMVAVVLVGMIF